MKGRLQAISLFAGVVLGCVVFHALARRAARADPQSPGLGRETTAFSESRVEGKVVSGYPAGCEAVAQSAGAFQSEGYKVVLLLGASQLHAINEYAEGGQLAVVNANSSAVRRGAEVRYVQISEANANLNELLSFYLQFRQHGVKPDLLAVAVVYDDLKERGVRRSDVEPVRFQLDRWRALGGKGVENLLAEAARHEREGAMGQQSPVKRNALTGTPQETLENALMKGLENAWPAFRARDLTRAAAGIWVRSAVMRALFRSNPRMTVEIPADLARWNLDGLDSLLAIARAEDVQVLLYEQPCRPEKDSFRYNREDYEAFYRELADQCARDGVRFADLEKLVPADLYGTTSDGRPDLFHFKAAGHRLLGGAIDQQLQSAGY